MALIMHGSVKSSMRRSSVYKLTKRAPQYAPSNCATMYITPRAIGNLASPLLNMHANVTAGLKCDPDIFQQKQVMRKRPAKITVYDPLVNIIVNSIVPTNSKTSLLKEYLSISIQVIDDSILLFLIKL